MQRNCLIKNYILKGWTAGFIVFLMLFFFGTGLARAHKVNVFAWVEGDAVFIESKFSGGKRVKGGMITVSDLRGNQLLSGKTNNRGEFSFKIPKKTTLKIVLVAGMGHRGEWTIPVEEIEMVSVIETRESVQQETAENEPKSIMRSIPAPKPCSDEIQLAVEKALDKKLKPIMKLLAESREQGPTFHDIFGGIGYIFGLVGLATYIHYRRKKD
jgi:nickel transport protein